MQTSNDWVDFHAIAETFFSGVYNIDTFVKDTSETTLEDIKIIAEKYFGADKWQLVVVGRTKEESINLIW